MAQTDIRAVVEGEVVEVTLASGTVDGFQYRHYNLRLFARDLASIIEVKLPGSLADEWGIPAVGDAVAYRADVQVIARGVPRLEVKAVALVAGQAKSNGKTSPPAPPLAAARS